MDGLSGQGRGDDSTREILLTEFVGHALEPCQNIVAKAILQLGAGIIAPSGHGRECVIGTKWRSGREDEAGRGR